MSNESGGNQLPPINLYLETIRRRIPSEAVFVGITTTLYDHLDILMRQDDRIGLLQAFYDLRPGSQNVNSGYIDKLLTYIERMQNSGMALSIAEIIQTPRAVSDFANCRGFDPELVEQINSPGIVSDYFANCRGFDPKFTDDYRVPPGALLELSPDKNVANFGHLVAVNLETIFDDSKLSGLDKKNVESVLFSRRQTIRYWLCLILLREETDEHIKIQTILWLRYHLSQLGVYVDPSAVNIPISFREEPLVGDSQANGNQELSLRNDTPSGRIISFAESKRRIRERFYVNNHKQGPPNNTPFKNIIPPEVLAKKIKACHRPKAPKR